ncbi:MAG: DEAD/DEAH box helicase, partial [Bacillota bacterium]|nr:DEAD/DEAH box helicase [Bacillota bacterium]
VYYSEDFKKLHVVNLGSMGLSLSSDDSLIYMNINLENVSDEELLELLDAINNKKKYYRLKNGSIINLSSVESEKFIDFLNNLNIDKKSFKDGLFEIPLNKCFYIENYLKEKGFDNVEIDKRLGDLMNKVSEPVESELVLDNHLNSVLRNYQKEGVKWLNSMARFSFGGILADDMGLGKTLQVLAFILAQKDRRLPCLVVAPSSIIYNWKLESEKFAPSIKALVITGIKERRSILISSSNDYDVIVTSYGALRNDIEDYKKMKFSFIFVDEAQNIKNPLTINANSVKSLKAGCCFAITGTPIENSLTELWSIFDFIMPGFLKDRSKFAAMFEEPIVNGRNQEKADELSRLIKPFILRRLKKDVLKELPEKIETSYLAEMKEEQKKIYAAYYKNFKEELLPQIEEFGTQKNHIEILAALTRLRQICAHPATFLDDYDGGSGKLEIAMELITQSINLGHSVLVFSQFTKMLKIVRNELENNNINYYYLDGSMKPEERMMEIDNFNCDREAVFLISLKAGGTGLNLTKADIIIHFDPWWNPAVEDQASDRAHRMGQRNIVQVYKLLTEGTIEEKIAKLQDKKRDLIESIIKPGNNGIDKLSEEVLRELFM